MSDQNGQKWPKMNKVIYSFCSPPVHILFSPIPYSPHERVHHPKKMTDEFPLSPSGPVDWEIRRELLANYLSRYDTNSQLSVKFLPKLYDLLHLISEVEDAVDDIRDNYAVAKHVFDQLYTFFRREIREAQQNPTSYQYPTKQFDYVLYSSSSSSSSSSTP